jgi:hypothetical protein
MKLYDYIFKRWSLLFLGYADMEQSMMTMTYKYHPTAFTKRPIAR